MSRSKLLFAFFFLIGIFSSCDKHVPQTQVQIPQAVRGVWLTNIASDVLNSRDNIRSAVALCHELGFNAIFVVTWNRGTTTYPSKVVEAVTGVEIQPEFKGRDPLKELIEEAKKYDVKIFAWFEFGFSSSYEEEDGGVIIRNRPHWASLDKSGNITEKNSFQWMNPFHPEVQEFISEMILEVVQNYEIDGIQGDDRLPALPSNGGYDPFTTKLYAQEHGGNPPPQYEKDYDWVKWRSGLLNQYLARLYQKVKAANPNIIVSMAPSIYPWSEAEYLQDWPAWVKAGVVDLVVPQVYRYNFKSYEKELAIITSQQISDQKMNLFFPGILLQVDDYNPEVSLLKKMIDANRAQGIYGEVFFFFEGVKKYQNEFKEWYGDSPVEFPVLNSK